MGKMSGKLHKTAKLKSFWANMVIRKLKNHKAAGLGGIHVVHWERGESLPMGLSQSRQPRRAQPGTVRGLGCIADFQQNTIKQMGAPDRCLQPVRAPGASEQPGLE